MRERLGLNPPSESAVCSFYFKLPCNAQIVKKNIEDFSRCALVSPFFGFYINL